MFNEFNNEYNNLYSEGGDKKSLGKVVKTMEWKIEMIGCSAIEDKL